jgi:hypothetical protein
MQIGTALLCDAATVRDNLLFVLGGGVTRLYRTEFPADMNVSLALSIQLRRMEIGRPHELAVDVIGEDGAKIAEVRGGFQIPEVPADMDVHEELAVPVVLPFAMAGVPAAGNYSIEISIDGTHHRTLPFRVTSTPPGRAP